MHNLTLSLTRLLTHQLSYAQTAGSMALYLLLLTDVIDSILQALVLRAGRQAGMPHHSQKMPLSSQGHHSALQRHHKALQPCTPMQASFALYEQLHDLAHGVLSHVGLQNTHGNHALQL